MKTKPRGLSALGIQLRYFVLTMFTLGPIMVLGYWLAGSALYQDAITFKEEHAVNRLTLLQSGVYQMADDVIADMEAFASLFLEMQDTPLEESQDFSLLVRVFSRAKPWYRYVGYQSSTMRAKDGTWDYEWEPFPEGQKVQGAFHKFVDAGVNAYRLGFRMPVPVSAGQAPGARGYVVAWVDVAPLWAQLLTQDGHGTDGVDVFLADGNGRYILVRSGADTHAPGTLWREGGMPKGLPMGALMDGQRWDSGDLRYRAMPLSLWGEAGPDLMVGTVSSLSRALRPFTQAISVMIVMTVVTAGLLLLVAFVGGRALRRPFDSLMNALRRFQSGDHMARSVVEGPREFRELAALFNQMADMVSLENEKLFRVVDQSPLGIVITDRLGLIEFVNPHMSVLSGYQTHELVGQKPGILGSGRYPRDYHELWSTVTEGRVWHGEFVNITKTGESYTVQATVAPVRDAQGEISNFVGILEDVTALRAMSQQIKTSEIKYKTLFDMMPMAITISDQDGNIVENNSEAGHLLGLRDPMEPGYRIDSESFVIVKPDGTPFPVEEYPSVIALREGRKVPSTVLGLQGSQGGSRTTVTWLSVLAAPVPLPSYGVVVVYTDISDMVEMTQALQEAQQTAEQANRAKSAFLANMSHDIRTPLNAILGFTQLLQRDPLMTQRQRSDLATIRKSGEHLLGLINNILEISRIEAGKVELEKRAIRLADFVDELVRLFVVQCRQKGLDLVVSQASDLPEAILCDETKLRRICTNLLGNAIKFTSAGTVSFRIWIDGRLHLEVSDTGPGMLPEVMERIFDAFEQSAEGREMGGTGLGLTISRDLARIMGGDISVSSTPGEGSRFVVSLPWEPALMGELETREGRDEPCPSNEARAQGLKALVIDDHEDNRALMLSLLSDLGFTVEALPSAGAMLEACARYRPDVILMDLRMPGISGFEALKLLEESEFSAIPVLVVSASVEPDARELVEAAGARDFLPKPFAIQDLLDKLRRVLPGRLDAIAQDPGQAEDPGRPAGASVTQGSEVLRALVADMDPVLRGELRDAVGAGDMASFMAAARKVSLGAPALGTWLEERASAYDYRVLDQFLNGESSEE